MITVVFSGNENVKNYITGLWQYDFGQVLRIQGLDLPTAVEIHFSLQETEGEAVTRIGTTKDGVTDVVIPDSMLENEDTEMDYNIYVFIYLTDEGSGETEKKITLKVKSRPRPEAFNSPEDGELFREVIKEVNNAADRAEEAEENASKYAAQTKQDAEQTAEDRREVERIVETVSDIGEHVDTVREYRDQAQTAATNALLSEQKAAETKETVIAAQAGAESAEDAARQYAADTQADKEETERLATRVSEDKASVEQTEQNFEGTVQRAVEAVNTAGTEQINAVQEAGTQAVEQISTAKNEAVKTVEDKGAEQVQAVEEKGQEVLNSFPDIPDMDAKLDKQQGAENAGKFLIVGEDGNVALGEVQPGSNVEVDATLTQQGKAADAKATGDKILQYAIKNTAQGESIVLQDSADEKLLDLKMQGRTEQAAFNGNNLFDEEKFINPEEWQMSESLSSRRSIKIDLKQNEVYTISVTKNNTSNINNYVPGLGCTSSLFLSIGPNKNSSTGNVSFPSTSKKLTFTAGAETFISISPIYGDFTKENLKNVLSLVLVDLQIQKGETVLPYEPYVGGKRTPNPESPQEIINAGKKDEDIGKYTVNVKLTGKNLWNPVSEDYVQGSYRGWYIDTEAEYITLSIRNKDESVDVSGLYLGISANGVGSNLGVQWVSLNVGNSVNKVTLKYKYVTIYPPSDSNLQKLLDRFYIQVEEGRAATEYEPYKEQLVTLVSDRLITKFDRLEKRDGVWGWAFKTGTLNLQDLDVFTIKDDGYTNNLTHRVYRETPDAVANSDAFCNKLYPFAAGDISGIKVADYECFNISNGDYLQMKLLKERGTTVDELKAFFAESDIYVMYESVEEEFVHLSQEEQELLNNLYTYYPTTIISNSEDCEMQMIYAADTTTYVNNKIAEIAEVALKGV